MVNPRNELTVIAVHERKIVTAKAQRWIKHGIQPSHPFHQRIDYVLKWNGSNEVQNFINQFFCWIYAVYRCVMCVCVCVRSLIWFRLQNQHQHQRQHQHKHKHARQITLYCSHWLYNRLIISCQMCCCYHDDWFLCSVSIYLFICAHWKIHSFGFFIRTHFSTTCAHFSQPNNLTFPCISDTSHPSQVLKMRTRKKKSAFERIIYKWEKRQQQQVGKKYVEEVEEWHEITTIWSVLFSIEMESTG